MNALINAIDSYQVTDAIEIINGYDAVNLHCREALFKAVDRRIKPVINALLSKGVDINVTDGTYQTPLFYAIANNSLDMIDFLLENGADINFESKKCETPLVYASGSANEDTIALLINKGADVHGKDDLGNTALMMCASRRQLKCVLLLLEKGIDSGIINRAGKTASDYALNQKYFDVVDLIKSFSENKQLKLSINLVENQTYKMDF